MMTYSPGKRSSFGQRVQGYATRRNESMTGGGGGKGFRFGFRWAPPVGTTTLIRLLPGNYLGFEGEESEYFPYVEHFVKRSNRGFVCSKSYQMVDGSLSVVGGKCLGCKERENGAEDISSSVRHAFNVLHLAWYHKVPVFDDNGRPIRYTKGKREGEQVMEDRPCEGRRCQHCAEKLEKFFGRHVHWSIGAGHMNELAGFVSEIERDCAACGEGRLSVAAYECGQCGHPVIDMNVTEMEPKAIDSFVARPRQCPKCDHSGMLIRQVECDHCQDPIPLSIFDCDLEIKRQGEGTNSTIQIPRWNPVAIESYREKIEDFEDKLKPYVFKQLFTPDPFDIQAKILKIKNPWGSDAPDADKHSRRYETAGEKAGSEEDIPY